MFSKLKHATTMSDREKLRRILQQQRATLTSEQTMAGSETIELDQSRIGRLSRAEAMQDHEMSLEVRRRREAALKEIEHTLEHLDDEDYGLCDECGTAIAEGRLVLNPAVRLCIDCATAHEQHNA
ncbi:MAG TPA: conjugal transfer protein TraR [Gammaproteobacteria bacterium]|nr:TraR/DksA family transcriptional regulator [Arenicellales bacterium]MDP6947659.1 TraR/DksA family transcriptional regulator [Arenicellales bacterium]HCY13012.1 conjugal transfer protein TraR [Gammaproteobacteria bacterium]